MLYCFRGIKVAIVSRAESFLAYLKTTRWAPLFTWLVRISIALAFLESGLTKVVGARFTLLGTDTDIGFFFEALYRAKLYWRFIGAAQISASVLLLVPRTTVLGAVVFFPIMLNIFVITWSLQFQGTVVVTSLMLLANIYLLCWHWPTLKVLFSGERTSRR